MTFSFPRLSLTRPITVVMLVITMLILGVISITRIPLEFLPKMDFPFIICVIPYAGATPEQVEKEVSIPAEGQFRTLSNLKSVMSTSDTNGSSIRLIFDLNTDMTVAGAEVRDRMERLKLELPAEIDRILLRKFSSSSLPIVAFAIHGAKSDDDLAHLARTVIYSRLMRIDGVADVTVYGKSERDVLIEFDQDALRSRGLGLAQVVETLRLSSLNLSIGDLDEGTTKYLLRAVGEFDSLDQISDLIIGPASERLRDVARVGYRTRDLKAEHAIDGESGTFVLVQKEAEANAVETCQAVKKEIDALATDPQFAGVKSFMIFDQSEPILGALDGLLQAGKSGAVLAIIVLFLFLWRIRPTLIVAFAIPSSVVFALVYMYFAGMSLNLITMISLIIALGMLIDDSIVVIENTYRYQQLGYSPYESAMRGAEEVALAITASALTTIVVFLPLFYLDAGEMSTYMRQFAAPITVCQLSSLLIGLTVIPLAASRLKPRSETWFFRMVRRGAAQNDAAKRRFWRRAVEHVHSPARLVMRWYTGTLAWCVRWRMATVTLTAAVIVITVLIPVRGLGRQGMPSVDTREVDIQVLFDQSYTLERARDSFNSLYAIINEQREELGIRNVFMRYDTSGGSVQIYLTSEEDEGTAPISKYTTDEVLDILWQRLPARFPAGELRFTIAEAEETSTQSFSLKVCGNDSQILEECADQLKRVLKDSIPSITEISTDTEYDRQEIQLRVDEGLSSQFNLSPLSIAQSVDFALRGVRLSYLKQGGREIPIWAQFQEEDRTSRSNLENVTMLTASGESIPINRVVKFVKGKSPRSVNRVDGKNVVTITAKFRNQDLGKIMNKLRAVHDDFELPQGYSIKFGDELLSLEEDMSSFSRALFMAVILIYIVMGALFESWLLPLSILMTLPLAGIGVAWALYLTNTPLDLVALIGIILLAGIVVKNGIVLVDFTNQLRSEGLPRMEAIVQAGRDRLRPVLMTALTTILGCVPVGLSGALGAEVSFSSLGRAIIGGMITGTCLTLFIVPVTYTLIDDFADWARCFIEDVAHMLFIRRRPAASTESS